MTEDKPARTPPELANSLRRLLRRHGVSERSMSELLGRGHSWLSGALRGLYPLTFEAAEQIARHLGLSLRDVLSEAYPNPADPLVSPYALLIDLAPEKEERPLPDELRDELDLFLTHQPKVQLVESPKYEVLRGIQNSIWEDRSRVVQYAMFHLSDAMKPRHVHTFIGALAILSDVLRACRSVDLFHRTRILLRAHELLELYPHHEIAALLTEKTACLCWHLTSNPQTASMLLEEPSIVHHPFSDHMFACRAWFHMVCERVELALTYSNIVFALHASPITVASAHSTSANAYANQGNPRAGVPHIAKALSISELPSDLRINLEAEAARLQVLIGEPECALEAFLAIIENTPYCTLWPVKAAFVARDFLRANPSKAQLKRALPHLLKIQSRLDIKNRTEAALLHSLAPYLASATATSPMALQKKDVDPNG